MGSPRRRPSETVVANQLRVEGEREFAVRVLPCPVCGVGVGEKCVKRTGAPDSIFSHVKRYYDAVDVGLVPPLPGVREGWR